MAKTEQTPQRGAPDRPLEPPRDGDGGLQELVERVRRATTAEWAGVASLSPAQRHVRWMAGSGAARDLTHLFTGDTWRRLASSPTPVTLVQVDSAVEDSSERAVLLPRRAMAATNLLLLPLRARGELTGVLCVAPAGTLGPDEKSILENLAELAALTLDNVLLLETVGAAQRVWEQTFDALTDGIIVYDDQSRIVRCNLRAAQVLGLASPAEAVGLFEKELLARLFGKRAAAYHAARRAGEASSFELQSADGGRYLVAMAPLQLADGPRWRVLTWSDVTELSALQERLARSRRLALAGQLAAGVAHEINNPLTAITTCAETMLLDLSEGPEFAALAQEREWIFYLEEIVRQALRGKGVTQGLLDLSRQRSADLRPCDINLIVAQCSKLYEPRAGERIMLKTEYEPQLAPVLTDEAMLRQILDNLLRNALDALEQHAAGAVTISTSRADDCVVIAVADTGPGISAELMPRLFEPFYTTKEVGRGSGLGLAISSALAESLGGALMVESKEGAGSCFRLALPYRTVAPSDV